MTNEFATAAVVTIPVLAIASIVEITRHRKELDDGMEKGRRVLAQRAEEDVEQVSSPEMQKAELQGTLKGLDDSKRALNLWFVTGIGGAVAEVGCFWWLGGTRGPSDWLAWWCLIDIALFVILLVVNPTLTLTGGPTIAQKGEKSALDLLKEEMNERINEL